MLASVLTPVFPIHTCLHTNPCNLFLKGLASQQHMRRVHQTLFVLHTAWLSCSAFAITRSDGTQHIHQDQASQNLCLHGSGADFQSDQHTTRHNLQAFGAFTQDHYFSSSSTFHSIVQFLKVYCFAFLINRATEDLLWPILHSFSDNFVA